VKTLDVNDVDRQIDGIIHSGLLDLAQHSAIIITFLCTRSVLG
jgi:hypothetical protein